MHRLAVSVPQRARAAHSATDATAFSECAQLVRTRDADGWLCTLLLPAGLRPAALAVRAYNVETAHALDSIREAPLAQMRLRWWRDAAESALGDGGGAPSAPVPRVLAAVGRSLPASGRAALLAQLTRLTAAREGDAALRPGLPPGLEALGVYADATGGALLRALLLAAAADSAVGLQAAGEAGTAAALAALLAGARAHLSRGRVYLPQDLLLAQGVSADALRFEGGGAGARQVVAAVAEEARARLAAARALLPQLSPSQRALLLPAVPAGLVLNALAATQHDAFADSLARRGGPVSPFTLRASLAWHRLKGTF